MSIADTLTSKKFLIAAGAVVVAAGVGGIAYAVADDRDELTGSTLDQASAAALKYVGEGKVTDSDRGDKDAPEAYEVEVTRPDGTEVDVRLDDKFAIISVDDDRPTQTRPTQTTTVTTGPAVAPTPGATDDDRILSADEQRRASDAALAKVPGTVVDVDTSDDQVTDRPVAYEVEVRAADGAEWNVWLDDKFAVITATPDN